MIIIISVYDSKTVDFDNNGLVVLSDCISCIVEEEINGIYEATIEYPLDERGKWKYLLEDNIIKVDGQLFRIYHKVKTLTSMKVNARHIYYDLLDNFLEDVRPTNLSGASALNYILANTQYAHSFTSMGDVGGLNTKYFVRKNVIEAIMGKDGIIDTWGGELVRNNFAIQLLGARGLDRGVLVAYGKNVQGIEETLDMDGVCTRLMPIGKDGLLLTEKYIDSPYINNFAHPKIKVIELSDYETEATLRAAAISYMANNKIDIPQFNYKIDFLELSKTEEYKNYAVLERVFLGDTVTIKHSKLNIDLKAKVIKTTKNILSGRIEKIELGSFKPSLATAINNVIQEANLDIVQIKSDYQKAIENATDLITGTNGGNVVIRQNTEGKPYEILIMDTTDVMTSLKCWRWGIGGFGYSSTGINGPYETAITMDGSIVGKFIAAMSISASQIKTNELIVGNNIAMGPNAIIAWNNLSAESKVNLTGTDGANGIQGLQGIQGIQGIQGNQANLPAYITSTKITSTTIESPYITGGLIRGATVQQMNGGTILNEFGKNSYGGLYTVNDINGLLNVSIGAESGAGANTGGTIKLYNDGVYYPRVELGIDRNYDAGVINLKGSNGVARVAMYAGGSVGNGVFVLDSAGTTRSFLRENDGRIGNSEIATQDWVNAYYGTALKAYGNYVWLPNGCYLECLFGRLILHADGSNYISIASTGSQVYVNGVGHNI